MAIFVHAQHSPLHDCSFNYLHITVLLTTAVLSWNQLLKAESLKSLVLRLFKLADGDQTPEPCSKLLVSWDNQTNGQVMSRAWERKRVAKSRGNKFRCTCNKRTWTYCQ